MWAPEKVPQVGERVPSPAPSGGQALLEGHQGRLRWPGGLVLQGVGLEGPSKTIGSDPQGCPSRLREGSTSPRSTSPVFFK